jgi:hypothetical protein
VAPRSIAAILAAACAAPTALGVAFFWPAPDLDSRTYPFVGQRSQASEPVFGQYNIASFVGSFDNRDSQIQIAYDTDSPCLPASLPQGAYEIVSVTLRLTVASVVGTPRYDPTQDDQTTYPIVGRAPVADTDLGRPVELFGAAFRNGYTGFEFGPAPIAGAPLFGESGEGYGPSSFGQGIRHVFPTDYAGQLDRDVSNNLDEPNAGAAAFNALPFAIGTTTLAPGAPITPGTVFTFTITPGPGGTPTNATRYIQRALSQGQLGFVLATLLPASGGFGGGEGGDYLFFALSENGANAPTLRIELAAPAPACVGDIDCVTGTSAADFTVLAGNFGAVGVGRAQGDLNGDGVVNAADFTILASNFGCAP